MTIHPLASPLSVAARPELTGGRRVGVLLSHGFTGSPASMKPWGEFLAERGYAVEVPRLPGHGTTWQDMNKTAWNDWYGEASRVFEKLGAENDAVVVGRPLDGGRADAAPRRRPARPGRRRRGREPGARHEAARREAAAGAQARRAVLPGHHQRHQEAGDRGARLRQDPAPRRPLDVPGVAAARRRPAPRSPRRCSTSARPSTTSSTSSPSRSSPAGCPRGTSPSVGSSRATTSPPSTTTRRRSSRSPPTSSHGSPPPRRHLPQHGPDRRDP